MRRVCLPLALSLALAGCTPDLTPEAAREAAHAAEASGDARAALRYYKAAAKHGDLDAMATLAEAYERGYHTPTRPVTPVREGQEVSEFMPILALPGQARLWRSRYESGRDERAFGGDPNTLMRVADELDRNRNATPAERDSALAIRQRLLRAKHTPMMLQEALMSMRDDSLRADALLIEATDLGSAQACLLRLVLVHGREAAQAGGTSAAMLSDHIDEIEACPPFPAHRDDMGAQVVIRQLVERDTPEARASLDSLRILGVFERHPHLEKI